MLNGLSFKTEATHGKYLAAPCALPDPAHPFLMTQTCEKQQ
ncbi:hypothetical protein EMIT0P253_290021 [Pseudomonas sp. IT-P253]